MMRYAIAALLLAVTAVPVVPQSSGMVGRNGAEFPSRATATVWGQVRSERTGAPLRHAVVEIVSRTGQQLTAVSDSNGVYVLRDVPPGRRLVRATHIDHAPHEVELLVVAERQQPLDFDLEFRPLRLSAVLAEGARGLPPALDTVAVTQPDLGPASARVLESTPGVAELGLMDAIRDVPGHEPPDPSDVLFVRGSATDLKLVLLNGAPVYAPFHIGGLIQALDADVLRSAALYLGGAPARYDGGLSYIMDLDTRSGRATRMHGRFGLDMLSARGRLEGPIGDGVTMLTAGRMVHGAGTASYIEPFPYYYGDVLSRVDVQLATGHVLTTTGFWNREEVRLDTVGAARQEGSWGNHAGSLRYRGSWSDMDMQGTVALTQFRTRLPLGGVRPLVAEATATRGRVAVDFERAVAGGRFYWGASADRIEFDTRAVPQGMHRDSSLVQSIAVGDVGGIYGEAAFSLLPRVRVRGGVRADLFSLVDGVRFAPRLSTTVLLTDRVTLTLTGGQYRQYVRAPERSVVFQGPLPDTTEGPPLAVAEATHIVLGVSQDLGEGIRVGLEGFFKEFTGLHAAPGRSTESSGVDLWVRRPTGTLTGWLGYSLAWVWTVEAERPRPSQAFTGRHLVSAGLAGPLLGTGVFDVRVSYGAGLPFTAVPEPPATSGLERRFMVNAVQATTTDVPVLAADPKDPYFRVDAQISRSWAAQWGSFAFEVTPYLKVINALNRRDAIFYQYNRDTERAEPLAGLPFMPILGAEWKF